MCHPLHYPIRNCPVNIRKDWIAICLLFAALFLHSAYVLAAVNISMKTALIVKDRDGRY